MDIKCFVAYNDLKRYVFCCDFKGTSSSYFFNPISFKFRSKLNPKYSIKTSECEYQWNPRG